MLQPFIQRGRHRGTTSREGASLAGGGRPSDALFQSIGIRALEALWDPHVAILSCARVMRDPAFLVDRVLAQQAMPTPQPVDAGAPAR